MATAIVIRNEPRDSGTRTFYTELFQNREPVALAGFPGMPDPVRDSLAESPQFGQRRAHVQVAFNQDVIPWEADGFVYGRQQYPMGIDSPSGRQLAWRERANIPIPLETSYGQLLSWLRGERE